MGIMDDLLKKKEGTSSEEMKASVKGGYCPGCGAPLNYSSGDSSVVCPCCDRVVNVSSIMNNPTGDVATGGTDVKELLADIRSMEGVDDAVVFLKNYFETYDWTAYAKNTIVLIHEVEAMVKSVKVKSGSKPAVWSLDFDSVYIPLMKKIEGLAALEEKMASLYSDVDNTKVLASFDSYKNIIKALIANKDACVRRLTSAVGNGESLGLDKARITEMKANLKSISGLLDGLKPVEDIYDVDALEKARKAKNAKKARELSEKGIDAAATYNQAVEYYNSGRVTWNKALDLFVTISGYSDADKYIKKIDSFFVYNKGEVIMIAEKPYVLRKKAPVQNPVLANAKDGGKGKDKPAKNAKGAAAGEEEYAGVTFELYPIVNNEPTKDPVLKGITDMVSTYGSKLFYIQKGKKLCVFDTETAVDKEIDEGKYNIEKTWYSNSCDKLYIRKTIKLVTEKLGCLKSLFKKPGYVKHVNNYSLVEIDLSTNAIKVIAPEIVDVYEFGSESIFYTFAEEKVISSIGRKNKVTETVTKLMVVDLATGASRSVLNENCDIHKVYENKVIFSYHTPNALNQDLYVYDLQGETETLIEKNVYDYVDVVDGKVFYVVGNAAYSPLFSNSLDGTDRVEILANVEQLQAVVGEWIYVIKGIGANKTLIKVSTDGKTVLPVVYNLSRVIKITDAYIYYLDYFNQFCSVRFDGKDYKVIASNINKNIVVGDNAIYYMRKELVNKKDYGFSLYRMDMEGHNVIKLAFNVTYMADYNDEKLYFSQDEFASFEITIPEAKGKSHVEYVTNKLNKVIEYNKVTGEFADIRIVGLPSKTEYEIKKGCLGGKTEKVSSTYKRVPSKPTYFRDVEGAGEVFSEQVAAAEAEKAAAKTTTSVASKSNPNANSGCALSSLISGCSKK